MKEFLCKSDKRRLDIIEYLIENPGQSVINIKNELNCSVNTVTEDIAKLNLQIYPISIQNAKGYFLNIPDNYSQKYIYSSFFHSSVELKCLEIIFFNPDLTMEELSYKLYVSETTVRRTIFRLNSVLIRQKISITTNRVKFVGSEKPLRILFAIFFSEKYSFDELPLSASHSRALNEIVEVLSEVFHRVLNYHEVQTIRLWIWIGIVRTQHKNWISIEKKDLRINKIYQVISEKPQLIDFFENTLKIEVTKTNIFSVFYVIFQNNFLLDNETLINVVHLEDFYEHECLLESLEKKFDLRLTNREYVLTKIENINRKLLDTSYILYPDAQLFYSSFCDEFPKFSECCLSKIKRLYENRNSVPYIVFYTLITSWKNLTLQLHRKKTQKKVLLFFDTDIEHLQMLKQFFDLKYIGKVEITISSSLCLEELEEESEAYDLIITNLMNLQINHKPIFAMNLLPSRIDWEKLNDRL